MRKKSGNSLGYSLSYEEASLIDFVLRRQDLKRLYDAAKTNDLVNKLKSIDLDTNIASTVESLYCAMCYEFKLEDDKLIDRHGFEHMRSEEEAISFIKNVHTSNPQCHNTIKETNFILQKKVSFPKISTMTSSVIRECSSRECVQRRETFGTNSQSNSIRRSTNKTNTTYNGSESSDDDETEEKEEKINGSSNGNHKRKRSDTEVFREQLEKKVDTILKYNESVVSNLNFIIKNLNENIEHLKERLKMQECEQKSKIDKKNEYISRLQLHINKLSGTTNWSMTIPTTSS